MSAELTSSGYWSASGRIPRFARHSLFDLVHMEDELRELFRRDVDLVTRRAVERSPNAWRRRAILGSVAHVAHAS